MNIELKGFKHYARLSEETVAFDANLYVDGKKVGTACNRGTGGENSIYVPSDLYAKLDAYAKALPPVQTSYGKFPMSLDLLIGLKVEELLRVKEAAQLNKRFAKKAAEAKALGQVFFTIEYEGTTVEGRCSPASVKDNIAKAKAKYGENGKETVFA